MSIPLLQGLRLRGIDVTTTSDAKLVSAPDASHLGYAQREGRVVFTNDADFLRFAAAGVSHAGIAFFPRGARSIGFVVRYLCLLHDCLNASEMRGKVEYF